MRDIRHDLRERLAEIDIERQRLKKTFSALDRREALIRQMLGQEDDRWSGREPTLFAPEASKSEITPIRAFLIEAMSDGRSWSLGRLKQRAFEKQLEFKAKRPGPALHAALVAMKRIGLVEMVETGVWKLAKLSSVEISESGVPHLVIEPLKESGAPDVTDAPENG